MKWKIKQQQAITIECYTSLMFLVLFSPQTLVARCPPAHQVVTSHENINLLSPASGSGSGSESAHVRNNTKQLQEEAEIPKRGGKQWMEGKRTSG